MKPLVILLIFFSALRFNAQEMLQYDLQVNDVFKVEQQAKQHITQDINGIDQVIENHLKSAMQFKVVQVTQELITFEMMFTHLQMTMSSPSLGELMHADTNMDAADDDLTSKMFKGTLNIPVTLSMERTGKIRSVTGGEKLIASMFKTAGITDIATIADNTPQFEKQFGSAALSNSFEQMTYFLPAATVKEGNTWTNNYSGDLKAQNIWTLDSLNIDSYKISGKATTTMSNIDENVEMVLKGQQKTTIEGNYQNGIFKKITVRGTYSGDTEVFAQDIIIPTEITSTITYKQLN